jgi:hypothetical protein
MYFVEISNDRIGNIDLVSSGAWKNGHQSTHQNREAVIDDNRIVQGHVRKSIYHGRNLKIPIEIMKLHLNSLTYLNSQMLN